VAAELRPYIPGSYALRAYLGGEPGCQRVQSLLSEAEQGLRRAFATRGRCSTSQSVRWAAARLRRRSGAPILRKGAGVLGLGLGEGG
jgi:hypothetical protein